MNPEQWLSLKWNGGSTMSDRWLNQSKIIHKKDCDALGQYFKIKATYTINGKKIVRAKSSSIIYKAGANADNVYLTNVGKVQYSCLDSMRTLGVKYNAKVHFQGIYGMPTTIYAEFNYNG